MATVRIENCVVLALFWHIDSAGIVKPVSHAVIRRGGKASNFEGEYGFMIHSRQAGKQASRQAD